jgi:hypothetical protein
MFISQVSQSKKSSYRPGRTAGPCSSHPKLLTIRHLRAARLVTSVYILYIYCIWHMNTYDIWCNIKQYDVTQGYNHSIIYSVWGTHNISLEKFGSLGLWGWFPKKQKHLPARSPRKVGLWCLSYVVLNKCHAMQWRTM